MKKTKILSLILCLALFCTAFIPGAVTYADEEPAADSGMKLSKSATDNGDGSYTITLEAYATGEKTTSTVTKDVPTDIVLVLDLSSSMKENIGTVSYSEYSDKNNEELYALRHNGGEANLWYKDGNSYYSVSVTVTGRTVNYTDASTYSNSNLYSNGNNLYAKIGDDYVKVTVDRSGNWRNYTYTYTYTYAGETKTATGTYKSDRGGSIDTLPSFDDGVTLWVASGVDTTNAVYTYTYTDSTGVQKTITNSTGGTTVPSGRTFYSRSTSTTGGGTRLAALKTACTNFAEAVAAKCTTATGTTVNHRIAVVGFNTNSYLYIGSRRGSTDYSSAFQDMSTDAGKNNVNASINALSTSQGTVPGAGLSTANSIFNANPITEGETRNRVVVLFTDGYPSTSGSSNFDSALANDAITQAATAKNDYKATVYTVAILAGADPTSAGDENGTNPEKVNWYLQTTSSNNGTPQSPSYYLSASDAESLNNIFQQISQQIETGGSSSTLTDEAVVKDIISPQFTLPEGSTASDITLKTYAYKGNSFTAENAWEENTGDAMGATATVDGDTVSVTGFNFSKNWCGTESGQGQAGNVTYRGNKLVISFKVEPKKGFLGGNGVKTNNGAGVYENKDAETPVESVEDPKVDIEIKKPQVSVPEANVYLGAYFTETVSAEALKEGTTVSFGTGDDAVTLDMSKPNDNWGLESWQNEYVDIEVVVKDAQGNVVTEFSNLREDTQYTVSVTIKPKGEETGDNSSSTGTIHVFKPELTYKDTTAYYGESVPANNDYSVNMVGDAKWKNGTKYSTDEDVTMLGSQTPPTLNISYTPDINKIFDGKYGKLDVPVTAVVKIDTEDVTGYTTFVHQACVPDCGWTEPANPGDPAFLIHVKTCTLSITKQGGAADESYVFDIYKDGVKYSEVTVWGNGTETLYELPVGTYKIQEDTGWSWRYSANNGSDVSLSAASPSGRITCTNTSNGKIYWLNGFSQAVRNIFGSNN